MNIPDKVRKTIEGLREKYPKYIILRVIRGRYYVYKDARSWDKERKKQLTKSEYLGKITDNGTFIKKTHAFTGELENAKAIIIAYGGKVVLPEINKEEKESILSNEIDNKILTILSMNSRASLAFISKYVGLTTSAVYNRIKNLEKRYDIKYTLDLNPEKLGYMQFLLLIKFQGEIPKIKEITEVLGNESKIQFVLATKGDYDIVAYLFEEDTYKAEKLLWKLRRETSLNAYDALWILTPLYKTYGLVQTREEFLTKALDESVKLKASEALGNEKDFLKHREFVLLREMNRNSVGDFTKIDKSNSLGRGASQYAYLKLKEKGIINRPTIAITKFPVKYVGVILIEFINIKAYDKTRSHLRLDILKNTNVLNKYALTGDIEAPNEGFLFIPIVDEKEFSDTVEYLKSSLNGVRISTLIGTDTLIGSLCYRRFDTNYTVQYDHLVKNKLLPEVRKIEYD